MTHTKRNQRIYAAYRYGRQTMAELAARWAISRSRVSQIVKLERNRSVAITTAFVSQYKANIAHLMKTAKFR